MGKSKDGLRGNSARLNVTDARVHVRLGRSHVSDIRARRRVAAAGRRCFRVLSAKFKAARVHACGGGNQIKAL